MTDTDTSDTAIFFSIKSRDDLWLNDKGSWTAYYKDAFKTEDRIAADIIANQLQHLLKTQDITVHRRSVFYGTTPYENGWTDA